MTEAESKLIAALLSCDGLQIKSEGFDTLDVGEALRAVAEERIHPEARAKFEALHTRHRQAQKDLFAFTDTLPPLVLQRWWAEKEKADK